jgi:low affinity Fe/Cu permease
MRFNPNEAFRKFSESIAHFVGSPWAFVGAVFVVALWAVLGPVFKFSDSWQLVINTGTTIVTFLIVFLIQNTQNRESRIMRLKLDELLRGVEGARTGFVSLDKMSDAELEEIEKEFERLKTRYAPLIEDDLEAVRAERKRRSSRLRTKAQGTPKG